MTDSEGEWPFRRIRSERTSDLNASSIFFKLLHVFGKVFKVTCPLLHKAIFSPPGKHRCLKMIMSFIFGFILGLVMNYFLWKALPISPIARLFLTLTVCIILGVGNAVCRPLRCISVLMFPMYCGKSGRGVLKALVLTFVIAGPIRNMAVNGREVVRVFACGTTLSYNMSRAKYSLLLRPFKQALFGLRGNIGEVEDAVKSVEQMIAPLKSEIEDDAEVAKMKEEIDLVDGFMGDSKRSAETDAKYEIKRYDDEKDVFQKIYQRKIEYRCHNQISREPRFSILRGVEQPQLETAFGRLREAYRNAQNHIVPQHAARLLCWPLKLTYLCNILYVMGGGSVCDSKVGVDPGIGEGYAYFKKAAIELKKNFRGVKLQYKLTPVREMHYYQGAQETAKLVVHSFEEKDRILQMAICIANACLALLFIRIIANAQSYHDLYLTNVEYDNIYLTGYFKRTDMRRKNAGKYCLLPLKKMERRKYVAVDSFEYVSHERNRLVCQALKLLLEVVTATTFVMLDRLLYEALDMVRNHARVDSVHTGHHDLEIQIEGTGLVAGLIRRVISGLNSKSRSYRTFDSESCLPRPRRMPTHFYLKIYGGYLWILFLLYLEPYTYRLRRLTCAFFYPKREKQRVLHLYNSILKKRMKMKKTLRSIAIRSMRAYQLSEENLLSLTLRFPHLLGWLRFLPQARKQCLICGEREPRTREGLPPEAFADCYTRRCPFVYCAECWRDIGEKCIPCDPALQDASDIDSISEDDSDF